MYRQVPSTPILNMSSYPVWYALYVKSRHEKKVMGLLNTKEFPYYLPIHKVLRIWSDRKKWVEEPLLRGYIFVPVCKDKGRTLEQYLNIPGIVSVVRFNGLPATISRNELKALDQFMQLGYHLEQTQAEELNPGDFIQVVGGPFKGLIGRVMREKNSQHFLVSLQSFNTAIKAAVPKQILKHIEHDSIPYAEAL